MIQYGQEAIAGLISPQMAEARIREAWPSVARHKAIGEIGEKLTKTIILAPLAWIVMGGLYFSKLLPFLAVRYTLTNRRLMIRRGWKLIPSHEITLDKIDDVRLDPKSVNSFFRCGDLEIISEGRPVFTLTAIPSPDSFRQAILNTRNAWVPGKAKTQPFIAASAK